MFSTRLKQLRKENKLSQDKIAEMLNVSRQSYGRYESGISEPSLDTLVSMSDILNVSLDYLLCRTDTRHNPNLSSNNSDIINKITNIINDYNCIKK